MKHPRSGYTAVGVIEVAIEEAITVQTKLEEFKSGKTLRAYTPPGIIVEAIKYPLLRASILASRSSSEYTSIFDHPEAWKGLHAKAILSMRKQLYRFGLTVDARTLEPSSVVEKLQKLALSVSTVDIDVEYFTLPPRELQTIGGQLPAGPVVDAKSIEIASEPEISRVAERITQQDIPASESIWKLVDYEYTLDQIARMMSVGLLGKLSNRRMVPTRSAYKAVIDSYVSRSIMELLDRPLDSKFILGTAEVHGDVFTVFTQPGMARVDYLRVERTDKGIERNSSFEGMKNLSTDAKTAIFADHARFEAYKELNERGKTSHVTIFHLARNPKNSVLGPWLSRAGVKEAFCSEKIMLDSRENAMAMLESFLSPNLSVWAQDTPLDETLQREIQIEPSFPVRTLG